MSPLRLYDYAASANCFKVRLLLAQLGREYERVPTDIFDGDTLTDEYERLNPFRSTPVLVLEDGTPLIESNAILWYLAQGTEYLPEDPVGQAEVVRWLIYEQSDVMPAIGGLRFRLVTGRFAADSHEAEGRRTNAYEVLRILEAHLVTRDFLVADRYTIADLSVFAYARTAPEAGIDTTPYASFNRWLERVTEQPGYMDDLAPYPPNASLQVGRSIYG
ncbi:MAG TPA: glutathione S-transferase family protein [Gaiellaceae bacterium]|nr:glutathione S-transferase family protein [Gaiellaceae bacterium]